ncbi:MAG: phosphatase PAP2 family protein [Planctomycetes bacterium]|nr:phosphatase PAP2 family protein [Planctomycetota bacterium]
MDPIQGLDWGAYYWFRTQRELHLPAVEILLTILAHLAMPVTLGLLGVCNLVWFWRAGNRRAAFVFVGSVVVALGILFGTQLAVQRLPPLELSTELTPLGSFPNGEALLTSLIYGVLALNMTSGCTGARCRFLVWLVAVVLILATGASVMYVGGAFLTDVLAGWAAGTLLVLVGDRLGGYTRGRPAGGREYSAADSGISTRSEPPQAAK